MAKPEPKCRQWGCVCEAPKHPRDWPQPALRDGAAFHLLPWTFQPARQKLPSAQRLHSAPDCLSCPPTSHKAGNSLIPLPVLRESALSLFHLKKKPPHQNKLCYFLSSHPLPVSALTPQTEPPIGQATPCCSPQRLLHGKE